jgi:hypothetical protein
VSSDSSVAHTELLTAYDWFEQLYTVVYVRDFYQSQVLLKIVQRLYNQYHVVSQHQVLASIALSVFHIKPLAV